MGITANSTSFQNINDMLPVIDSWLKRSRVNLRLYDPKDHPEE